MIKFLFPGDGEMRHVILKNYYMPNGLTPGIIHKNIPPHFREVGGEMKNALIKILLKNFTQRPSKF